MTREAHKRLSRIPCSPIRMEGTAVRIDLVNSSLDVSVIVFESALLELAAPVSGRYPHQVSFIVLDREIRRTVATSESHRKPVRPAFRE